MWGMSCGERIHDREEMQMRFREVNVEIGFESGLRAGKVTVVEIIND